MKKYRGMIFGLWLAAMVSQAGIIVDGVDQGMSYTLTGKAQSVMMDGGMLTVAGKGSVNRELVVRGGELLLGQAAGQIKGLQVSGGTVTAQGGLLHDPFVTGGSLLFNGESMVVQGLTMQGGSAELGTLFKLNGGITLSGNASIVIQDVNVSGLLTVTDDAVAYFGDSFVTDARLSGDGRVLDAASGSIQGNLARLTFSRDTTSSIYVGVIPEPVSVALILMVGLFMLVGRRLRLRAGTV